MATTDFTIKKSISLPKSVVEMALARAESQHRSFSNYLQTLIARDIERGRPRRIQEMNNAELFAGVPEEVVRRFVGLEEIPPKILADMTSPTPSECIEFLAEEVKSWLDAGYFGPYGEEDEQEYPAERIARALKAIALLCWGNCSGVN